MRQVQQLGSLKRDVHSLGNALQEAWRDNSSLAKELQAESEENKFLIETLREKVSEMKKALLDWLILNKTNQDLCLELSEIWSELEAEKDTPVNFSRKLSNDSS